MSTASKGSHLDRLERERAFYNVHAAGSRSRRALDRLRPHGALVRAMLWAPVWRQLDVAGKTVLECGCGAGDFSIELARRGATVYGIDIADESVAQARAALSREAGLSAHVEFTVQDAHHMAFPDGFFDCVIGNHALHHLDLRPAYAEIARVLKPGGCAMFLEPLDRHPLVSLVRRLTPRARTADERPLNFRGIAEASGVFRRVAHTEYFLLAVLATPLNLLSPRAAWRLTAALHTVDRVLFRVCPPLRRYAWMTMVRLQRD